MAFHALAKLVNLYDGCRVAARVERHNLLLVQWDGRVYVIENRCPHMDAPLATGQVKDGAIACRAHGIAFDLATGRAQGPLCDTLDKLHFYAVEYDRDWVGVNL